MMQPHSGQKEAGKAKAVKAVRFDPPKPPEWPEARYAIIDPDTGAILDDAQGYGYRTPQKAYMAWGYKHRDRSKDAEKRKKTREIKRWMKQNEDFVTDMEDADLQIAKYSGDPRKTIDAACVKEMLTDAGHTDLPFTAAQLLKVWTKGAL